MSQTTDVQAGRLPGAGVPARTAAPDAQVTPIHIFQTLNGFQHTAALRTAIELDIFSAIGEGLKSVSEIARRVQASERGIRILCDNLTVLGFLTKHDREYGMAPDSALFLDRRSPAYMGSAARFLNSREAMEAFGNLTEAVRKGTTSLGGQGAVYPENPIWVEFARSMAPMMYMPARSIAEIVGAGKGQTMKVLDIAAGHGLFGIAIARQDPQAEITALDWKAVLEVARENARKAGVESRYSTIPGSAFEAEFGSGYDLILLTNFLHHFDISACEALLRKAHAALKPGGRVLLLEFVPNDDRVTPPETAFFSLVMLALTGSGDAYTFTEYRQMFESAGFTHAELIRLERSPESVIIATR